MASTCPVLNCTAALISPRELQANPDVSGLGVLIGFLTTACFVLILLVAHYVLVFDPTEAALGGEKLHVNPIDVMVVNFAGRWVARQKMWEPAFEKMILMMSDQQMVTGIALLLSAATQLKCSISTYHWQIMIYSVWFSSFTHLATLTSLRGYLHKNSPMKHWRLLFMTILFVLLIAALVPTGNGNWLSNNDMAGVPAICLFGYRWTDESIVTGLSMLLSILVLLISYITRAIKLFETSSRFVRLFVRQKPENFIAGLLGRIQVGRQNAVSNRWILSFPYIFVLSAFLVARSWMDLFESMLWEIVWLLIALLWGSLRLFSTRNIASSFHRSPLGEDTWTFGQFLAIIMLALLLFAALETYLEFKREAKGRAPVRADSRPSSETDVRTKGDIGDRAAIMTAAEEFTQRPHCSTAILGVEELTVGTSKSHIQASLSDIELIETTQTAEDATTEAPKLPEESPHEHHFYINRWYKGLGIFNLAQALAIAAGILSCALGGAVDENSLIGLLRYDGNLPQLLQTIIDWIFVFAPFSSFVIAFPNVWSHTIQWRPRRSRFANARWVRKCLQTILFLAASAFSLWTLIGRGYPWMTIEPNGGGFMIVYVVGILVVIFVPWYFVAARKMKREARL